MAPLRTLAPALAALAFACSHPAPATAPAMTPAVPEAQQVPPQAAPAPTADQQFEALSHDFLEAYLRIAPTDATQLGDHRYDATWPDISPSGEAATRKWLADTRDRLAQLPRGGLSAQNQIDAAIIDDHVKSRLFELDELKALDKNPTLYTGMIGEGLDPLVSRDFGTKETRMTALRGRLEGIPALVAVARQRLGHPAKVETETAIAQNKGLIGLVEKELAAKFAEVPAQQAALTEAAKRAAAALHDFQGFLEKDLMARSDGTFRIGAEKFTKKLGFALGETVDPDELVKNARDYLKQTQEEMVETAKTVWAEDKLGKLPKLDTADQRKQFVKQVLDHLAKDHSTNQTILADAKKWLDKATAFVREHDLVRVPDEPVAVIEMPEYRRGVAIAYCDPSGPLEATPQTFYAISPTPSDWPKARVDSFYREYNQSMLADLSIHEAMPGHYLQLMHNNQFKSKLRGVFGSGPFIEGWAVYGEWLMAEHGFGGARVKLQRQKMMLRVAANAVLDHEIHAGNMEEKDALALMKGEALQEDGEAVAKWKRARLSSAQLSTYFYGFLEHYKMRKAAETKPGFNERAYHDRVLSYGSPAMKYIRELMAK
ncbi:MAG TPA: DUF885 domain-containing protein [Kofleriaceae bacterium]|nr:DUF885 domain-containing protein [Kofleriaceae bacterium]